jgi:hypothetical protein
VPGVSKDTGLEVLDLDTNPEFTARSLHTRDVCVQMEGLRRLTHSFVQNPDTILQELVNAAVDLCGADSAGISLETEEKSDANFYPWVATAGQYNGFLNAILPRYPSACGTCLDRGKPQLFRVSQRFFDIMGIEAPLVTDGILLPWQVEETRGTIFIMAHGRIAAFDNNDGQMMRVLADFAAMAVRYQQQHRALLQQAKIAVGAAMANKLAAPDQQPPTESDECCLSRSRRPERPECSSVGPGTLRRFAAIVRRRNRITHPARRSPLERSVRTTPTSSLSLHPRKIPDQSSRIHESFDN